MKKFVVLAITLGILVPIGSFAASDNIKGDAVFPADMTMKLLVAVKFAPYEFWSKDDKGDPATEPVSYPRDEVNYIPVTFEIIPEDENTVQPAGLTIKNQLIAVKFEPFQFWSKNEKGAESTEPVTYERDKADYVPVRFVELPPPKEPLPGDAVFPAETTVKCYVMAVPEEFVGMGIVPAGTEGAVYPAEVSMKCYCMAVPLEFVADASREAPETVTEKAPETTVLYQNCPNPFNPTTEISFDLRRASDVSLEIFNVRGELVTKLVDGYMNAGIQRVTWNGTNGSGAPVASGVYFYRLRTRDFVETKKMTLLR